MSYTPKPGTIPARVIEHLQDADPLSTQELNQLVGLTTGSITNYMGAALKAGLVKTGKLGNTLLWSLGDGTPAEPSGDLEASEETEPFNAARYMDGDLVIMGEGVEPVEGGFLVRAHCVAKLEAYLKATWGAPVAMAAWAKPEETPS